MVAFVLRRLAWAVVLVLVLTLITFVIFFVLPAAPISRGQIGTEEVSIRDAFEFSGPVWREYLQFVQGLAHLDLGTSLSNRRPIWDIVWNAAPITGALVLGGLLLTLSVAIPLGVLAAVRERTVVDRGTMAFVLIGISAHPAWIGLVLAYVFGYRLELLPISGYCDLVNPSTSCGGPGPWITHMLLPWATFALLFTAVYARMIRATVLESLREDYVRTARAKGLPESRVLRSHALRNSMLPVVTMIGLDPGIAFGSVLFVERVFGLPGLGGMMLEGLQRRDPPIVLGVVVFMSVAIVLINLVVDLVYTFVDPRIRTGAAATGGFRVGRKGRRGGRTVAVGTATTR